MERRKSTLQPNPRPHMGCYWEGEYRRAAVANRSLRKALIAVRADLMRLKKRPAAAPEEADSKPRRGRRGREEEPVETPAPAIREEDTEDLVEILQSAGMSNG